MSCGARSKGERLYDWALADAGNGRHLLVRRSLSGGELAYYLCWSPRPVTLAGLVKAAAGARRQVGEGFPGRNETALDHCQVCKHGAWYGHVSLAMCPNAWLAVIAAAGRPPSATSPAAKGR